MTKINITEYKLCLSVMFFAILTRMTLSPLMMHVPNFSAMDAMALFCSAYMSRRIIAIALILFAVWLSDLILMTAMTGQFTAFYEGFYWQYLGYIGIACIGMQLKEKNILRVSLACFISAVLFFLLSNFGVWYGGWLYPMTVEGLLACYIAALPFFKYTLMSSLFFSAIFFGFVAIARQFYKPAQLENVSR